ncbi:MAG: hypothetical protein CR982_06420 [Candidatus Cloacimonadota bacterium]|nr:MAG: hypothetical protein CR982_06420 [Candidatus Cloacimonadota bacterium]PIE77918.1 MAG: hypothetical protein CSA15_10525 [Candidatus Delongbacteria bacterium]
MNFFSRKKSEAIKRKETSEKYFNAGVVYYEKKDFINSKKYFEKAVEIYPENRDAIHNLKIVMKRIVIEKKKRLRKSQILNGSLDKKSINKITQNRFSIDSEPSDSKKNTASDPNFSKPVEKKSDLLKFFELDENSSNEEIKDKINKEFKKWRTKVNTSDLKKRYEAEKMLATISKARRKLIN